MATRVAYTLHGTLALRVPGREPETVYEDSDGRGRSKQARRPLNDLKLVR